MYYPSVVPYRAFFEAVQTTSKFSQMYYDPNNNPSQFTKAIDVQNLHYAKIDDDLYTAYAKQRAKLPWISEFLYVLGAGHISQDKEKRFWYDDGNDVILLKNSQLPLLVQGASIVSAFVLWDGMAGELLSVQSQWGLISC